MAPSSSAPSPTTFAPTATPSSDVSSSTTGSTTDLPSNEDRVVEPAPASPMETDESFSLMAPVPEVNQAPPIAEEPVSTSFDDSQKKRAEDFKATAPKVTAGSEGTKILRGKGKGKGTSTNTGEGGGKQTKGSGRKARARANRNATTPMGLCKNEYLKSHKGALPEEFKAHWEGLDEAEKKKWEAQSAEIIKSKGGGEEGDQA